MGSTAKDPDTVEDQQRQTDRQTDKRETSGETVVYMEQWHSTSI